MRDCHEQQQKGGKGYSPEGEIEDRESVAFGEYSSHDSSCDTSDPDRDRRKDRLGYAVHLLGHDSAHVSYTCSVVCPEGERMQELERNDLPDVSSDSETHQP